MRVSSVLASTVRYTYVKEALELRNEGRIDDCIRSLEIIARSTDKELLGNDISALKTLKHIRADVYYEMD